MAKLNERLVGRSFADCYGGRATVTESMAGLAPGYVCVRGTDSRQSVENLRYVLSNLDDPEPDLVLAADLLAHADALKERATEIAGAAATEKLSRKEVEAALEFRSSMAAALGAVRIPGSHGEGSRCAEVEQDPAAVSVRF